MKLLVRLEIPKFAQRPPWPQANFGIAALGIAWLARARADLYIGGSFPEPGNPMMDNARLKKLRFRAWHRGFREADLILGSFADAHLEQLSAEQIDAFEALIDQPDHDIYGWINGSLATPEAFDGEVLDLIRTFRFFAHTALGADHGG